MVVNQRKRAYGAAIYVRVVDSMNNVHVNLLIAKSKIAPTQPLTIPRLELMAADLLSKILKIVQSSMELEKEPCFFWSDSTITLHLRKPISELKIFIANRVKRIKENSAVQNWHHVRTHDNPADLVSRGFSANEDCKQFSMVARSIMVVGATGGLAKTYCN